MAVNDERTDQIMAISEKFKEIVDLRKALDNEYKEIVRLRELIEEKYKEIDEIVDVVSAGSHPVEGVFKLHLAQSEAIHPEKS